MQTELSQLEFKMRAMRRRSQALAQRGDTVKLVECERELTILVQNYQLLTRCRK